MNVIFAKRLFAARKMAGLSMQELADKLGNRITKQAISKYEQAKMKPDSEILIALSNALNVPVDYFFRETSVNMQNVEFRKRQRLSRTEEESIRQKVIDFLERYFELENILNIEPFFNTPFKSKAISSLEGIETLALEFRQNWNLGFDPISNVYEMLEDKGCKVFEVNASMSFDGLSAIVHGIPVIVINGRFDVVRRRFTALHELGHHLLKFSELMTEKEKEHYCHAFASSVLLPSDSLIKEISEKRKFFSLNELISLKEYWGISIKAIVYKAYKLEIIDKPSYERFMIEYNSLGFNKNEPGIFAGNEKALRFNQLLYRAAAEEVISLGKAAALSNQKLSEFRESLTVM